MSGRVDFAHIFVPKAMLQPVRDRNAERSESAKAIEEFLQRGGAVTEVAPGATGQDLSYSDAEYCARRARQMKLSRENRKRKSLKKI